MTTAPSSPDGPRPPLARLVELALVVPVEVSSRLLDAIPAVIDKVPSVTERVQREIVLARFIGKMAVDQGVREIRTRLVPSREEATATTAEPDPNEVAVVTAPSDGDAASAGDAAASSAAHDDVPDVATLALGGYDHLSSAQIVAKLDGLDAAERRAIERYERAGRHRRTILGKLERLGAEE